MVFCRVCHCCANNHSLGILLCPLVFSSFSDAQLLKWGHALSPAFKQHVLRVPQHLTTFAHWSGPGPISGVPALRAPFWSTEPSLSHRHLGKVSKTPQKNTYVYLSMSLQMTQNGKTRQFYGVFCVPCQFTEMQHAEKMTQGANQGYGDNEF